MTLTQLYQQARRTPCAINQHVPLLYDLARQVQHVTEFGTETGVSTTAFLYAQPETLTCYDIRPKFAQIETLERVSGRTHFRFIQADDRTVELAETDLLFIDTEHTYAQLSEELRLHGNKARRWIVMHDTETYTEMWPAIPEFVALGVWRISLRYSINNGLTVLSRFSDAAGF